MSARRFVVVLVAALVVYFGLLGWRGAYLLGQPSWSLKLLGAAVLVFPVIGVWVTVVELRFGRAAERLSRQLDTTGRERVALPRRPSGRVDRAAADEVFVAARARVEAAPTDWREWYLLAEAYDDAGDRRRARSALRTAIAYEAGRSP